MKAEELEVKIDPDGRVSILVRGAKGERCLDVTRGLEATLGAEINSRTYTAEYYETEAEAERQKLR